MKKWFDIRGAASEPEIWIYGDIGSSWYEESVTAAQFVKDIQAITADKITVRINSYGGSVSDGLAIHNAIKRHAAHVTTAIDGVAMSSASLIAMAGDTLEMAENGILMIHAPWMVVGGNAAELRQHADVLDKWAEAMATSYATKSGKSSEEILSLLTDGKDHYYTAAEALAEGFINSIVEQLAIAASANFRDAALARFTQSTPKPPKETDMTPEEKAALEAKAKADAQAAADAKAKADAEALAKKSAEEALAADKARRESIRAEFAPFAARKDMADLQAKLLEEQGVTAADAGKQILALLAKDIEPVSGSFRVVPDSDGGARFKRDAVASILVRANLADKEIREVAAKATTMRSFKLLDFARASLDRAGVNHASMNQMELVAAAFTNSTSDFPILLENTMHKALLGAYAVTPDTWSRFCATGSVSDFRAHNRYRVGSLGNLDTVGENSEFKNKSIPDGEKASITATTKGNIINLSRQMIINDDLGAFLSIATSLGRAAKRTVEAAVYALLAENSGMGPTVGSYTLFHASHSNVGTGAAITASSLDADRVVLASQTDIGGNEYLDLTPSVLLIPLSLGGTARVINAAQYDPDTLANKAQNKPNVAAGLFKDIVDTARITGTRRYLFADPNVAPVIEVAFLDGNSEPFIEQQAGFTVDGTQYKARLDFGVAGIDYRGAVTNAGQ